MSPLIQKLELGKVPRVVGTILTEQFLTEWRDHPRKLPCDMVELRVDGYPAFPDWIAIGERIENYETVELALFRAEDVKGTLLAEGWREE